MARSQKNSSIDTTEKEIIRRDIRHALSDKAQNRFPNIDLLTNLFEDGENPINTFVANYRAAGGKFIPCTGDQLLPRLMDLINDLQYKRLIAVDDSLIHFLKKQGKQVKKDPDDQEVAHAAIFHADALIAREGSICFTQKNILHTSIYNLAYDIIVVAKVESVQLELKEALSHLAKVYRDTPPFIEIATPSIHEIVDGKPFITPKNPRFILFMVV